MASTRESRAGSRATLNPTSPLALAAEAPLLSLRPGGSTKDVIRLALPIVISMLSVSMMGVMDTLFMGWLSTSAQAAVGLGAVLTFSLVSLFSGTWTAVATFAAQAYGADRRNECPVMVWQAGYLIIVGVVLVELLLIPWVRPLLYAMGSEPEVAELGRAYLTLRLHGVVFMFFDFLLASYFRGLADMKTPLRVALLMIGLNLPLTYVLAFGAFGLPALGVVGAALGTVLSQAVGTVAYLFVFFGRRNNELYGTRTIHRPDWRKIQRFMRIGLPIGVTWFLESGGWTFFTIFVAGLGSHQLAAHTIVMQILHLSFMPGIAIGMVATTLVGQYLGARDVDSAERAIRASILTAIVFMGSMGLLFLLLRTPLALAFNSDPTVVEMTRSLFILAVFFQVFDALGTVTSAALRGAGDTRWPMVLSLVMVWGLLIPGVWVFGRVLEYGLFGAWSAATAFIFLLGIILYRRLRAGKWRTMTI